MAAAFFTHGTFWSKTNFHSDCTLSHISVMGPLCMEPSFFSIFLMSFGSAPFVNFSSRCCHSFKIGTPSLSLAVCPFELPSKRCAT